jgi:hypothetical protein
MRQTEMRGKSEKPELPMTNMHAFLCTNALTNPMMMDLGTMGGSNSVA